MVPTVVGLLMVIMLMAFAAQVLLGLYAQSTLEAAAWDAAHTVARSGDPVTAERDARASLGRLGERATFSWDLKGEVVLTVTATRPSLLPRSLRRSLGMDTSVATVHTRWERVR